MCVKPVNLLEKILAKNKNKPRHVDRGTVFTLSPKTHLYYSAPLVLENSPDLKSGHPK